MVRLQHPVTADMPNNQRHESEEGKPSLSNTKFVLSLVALCAVNFCIAFEFTAIPLALPVSRHNHTTLQSDTHQQTIAQALAASSAEVFRIGTSFVVASAATQPVFVALSNPFGRKPLTLIGLV